MRWKVLLSGRVFPSIAQLTENTNVVRAINSTDLRGANKRASRGNGVVRLTSPTRSYTLVTEASFTSTGIKHQLSSLAMKPSTTFSPTRRNLGSRREQRYGCRTDQDLTEFLPRGGTLYWNRSIPRIGKHSLKAGVSATDITSILLATLTAPLKRVFRYTVLGGAGFIWAASFDQKDRGTLRLVAVDTSAFYSELIAKSLPSETR